MDKNEERLTYVRSIQRLTSDWDNFPYRLDKKGDDLYSVFHLALLQYNPCRQHWMAQRKQDYSTCIGRDINCYIRWVLKHMINTVWRVKFLSLKRIIRSFWVQCVTVVSENENSLIKIYVRSRREFGMCVTSWPKCRRDAGRVCFSVSSFFFLFLVNGIECKR